MVVSRTGHTAETDHTVEHIGRGGEHRCRHQGPFRPWGSANQGGGMCSDSESAGGSSESRSMDSPTASPGDFKRRLPRTPSTGTMSSADDLDDREPPSPLDNENATVWWCFMEPNCSLACHKKCLETLAIQCGHKKLLGRLHLFGIDFTQAARNTPDGVPFIIRKCTSEIENRALNIKVFLFIPFSGFCQKRPSEFPVLKTFCLCALKGIYRVNGAKSRVEKLCQAFENGKDLVELSELYPHDISNVLKLYLRQVGCFLPMFEPKLKTKKHDSWLNVCFVLSSFQSRSFCSVITTTSSVWRRKARASSWKTLKPSGSIPAPLQQPNSAWSSTGCCSKSRIWVTECSEENKMTASNLGIIFGPTLIKPRQADAEVSLSSLVDYPYQALIVELLIRHYQMIFDTPLSPLRGISPTEADFHPCLTQQEKEQLSRHSKSLGDIKEVRT
ncbi:hypothetical protein XENOCAPTIV_024531 [Xenoophorus captivus]|uniref:Rho-GAP domain-containing protein n=1 Tax=Xenoophorus captivus TaxID=1517983 RepID=A0ABV0RSW1_9TELE